MSTEMTWSETTSCPLTYMTLPERPAITLLWNDGIESVVRGIDQAAKGEGVEVDPDELESEDD